MLTLITAKGNESLCLNNFRVRNLSTTQVGHLLEGFSLTLSHNLPPHNVFCPPKGFQSL